MTTIAWDGEQLCADSLITSEKKENISNPKIRKIKGMLVAGCGNLSSLLDFFTNLKNSSSLKEAVEISNWKEIQVIVISNNKCYVIDDDCSEFLQVKGCYAIGSGGDFAKGAMDAGATARQAVRIAANNDPKTGGRIRALKIVV